MCFSFVLLLFNTTRAHTPDPQARSFHTQGALGLERLGVVPDTHRNLSCGCVGGFGSLDGCEVRLCDPCARVNVNTTDATTRVRPGVSRVCPGSPRCLFYRGSGE